MPSSRRIALVVPLLLTAVSHAGSGVRVDIARDADGFVTEAGRRGTEQGTELRQHAELVPDSGFARLFAAPFLAHEIEAQSSAMGAGTEERKTP